MANDVSIPKKMLSQNLRVYEKKLAGCRAYLVYKGKSFILQFGKILKKFKFTFGFKKSTNIFI